MTYTIKDHGIWRPYTPVIMPDWAKALSAIGSPVIFARRDSDRKDFYDYLKAKPFAPDAIVATTTADSSGTETVAAVYRDPTMIAAPFNQRLIEVAGVDPAETKPHNLLAWLTYHPDTLTFSGEPVPPSPPPLAGLNSCSKLGLIRAFRERGWWPAVKTMIASDADMQDDWDAATQLRTTDTTLRKAIANLPSVGLPTLTDADVQALVARANELVA
jgi:hypothetical protein